MKSGRPTTVTPFLVVKNGAKAIEFYKSAFEALVLERYDLPDGRVNAKIAIGGAELWFGDEEPEFDNLSPATIGGSAVRIVLTVNDPDTLFARALQAGASQLCAITTEEYWRIGKLKDPFGHIWEIGNPLSE